LPHDSHALLETSEKLSCLVLVPAGIPRVTNLVADVIFLWIASHLL
jgi:hypothetical protein